jgi:hypothetical protein
MRLYQNSLLTILYIACVKSNQRPQPEMQFNPRTSGRTNKGDETQLELTFRRTVIKASKPRTSIKANRYPDPAITLARVCYLRVIILAVLLAVLLAILVCALLWLPQLASTLVSVVGLAVWRLAAPSSFEYKENGKRRSFHN